MHVRVLCPALVGRGDELAALETAFAGASEGRPVTVLIGGEAGIGKSRLVDELRLRARELGGVAATGVCVPIDGGGLPYAAVIGVLRDLGRQVGDDTLANVLTTAASETAPGRGDLHPDKYSAVPHITDELAKTKAFEAVLACIARVAQDAPCVLVFEDLHWADSASAELFGFLARNISVEPLLLIGTYRSDELAPGHGLLPWLNELGRHARVSSLRLDGLAREHVAEMVEGIIGCAPNWALVDAVGTRSQGNPFFVEELTAARDEPALPPEFQNVVMTRVQAASEDAQLVARVVGAAGALATHELLLSLDLLDSDRVERALAELVEHHILVVDASRTGYAFRHELLREVVYANTMPGERVRCHRRIASALAADPRLGSVDGGRDAEVAGQWWAAGEWAASMPPSISAAEAAVAVWAFPEALVHFERALAAAERLPRDVLDRDERVRLFEHAADVAYMAGASVRSVELAREAIAAADLDADPERVARCYALLGRNAWSIGDSDLAFDSYRRAAALVPPDVPSVALARVLAEEARGLMLMSRFTESERRGNEALPIAVAAGARAEEGHIRYTLGCDRGCLGFVDEGIELVREALAIAEDTANADDLNRAYMGLSSLLCEAGRLEECVAVLFDGAAIGEEMWGVRLNGAAVNAVEALIRLGRHEDAESVLALTGAVGVGSCVPTPAMLRAQIAIRDGRADHAVGFLALADELSTNLEDIQVRGTFHLRRAELALLEGRLDDAHAELERALALAARTEDASFKAEMGAIALRTLADQYDDAREHGARFDTDKARIRGLEFVQQVDELIAARQQSGGMSSPRMKAFASMCAAEHSRLRVSDGDLWESAAELWDDAQEPYYSAYCSWRTAGALLAGRSHRARATACLQRAWRISSDLDVKPIVDEVCRLAQRARITLGDVDGRGPAVSTVGEDLGLTPREVEVLGHLALGHTDREIAASLFISKKTASVHVSNILRKLDLPNRVEAGKIGQAHELGAVALSG